jgi:hypothetical protein
MLNAKLTVLKKNLPWNQQLRQQVAPQLLFAGFALQYPWPGHWAVLRRQ